MHMPIAEAKAHFAELIRKAEEGEAIVLTRHGKPVAKLHGLAASANQPLIGALKGQIKISKDFDDLPVDFLISMSAAVNPE